MREVPFLRPNLVKLDKYRAYIESAEQAHVYSNFGPLNTAFEKRVIQEIYCGSGAGTTVSNATIGLMLAIRLLGRKGRFAVMPSYTFAAAPLAALWAGYEPYFVDIDAHSWVMDENEVAATIRDLGSDVGVVVPYATFGTGMELSFYAGLQKNGIPVVLDGAASFGAKIGDVGFARGFPGVVVYSFHATKAFAVGEGGFVYSGEKESVQVIRNASNFGFRSPRQSEMLGLNGKLSEWAAAISLATLDRLGDIRTLRGELYSAYVRQLSDRGLLNCGWQLQMTQGEIPHQFFPILCPPGMNGNDCASSLARHNIAARTYFNPACHGHPTFRHYQHGRLIVTEQVARRSLSLPFWEGMGEDVVTQVVEALAQCASC